VAASGSLKKRYGPNERFIVLPSNHPLHQKALRITSRKGSLILWDQRVCHGSAPNHSGNFRYAQFFKVFPADISEERFRLRKKAVEERVKQANFEGELTPLGRKMFGLERW